MSYIFNYNTLLIFITFTILFSLILVIIYVVLNIHYLENEVEKSSTYECGFVPFGDSRIKFDINFYVVSILFIIFDLEIVFLYPFATILAEVSLVGFYSFILFFFILTAGFVYEFIGGVLDL